MLLRHYLVWLGTQQLWAGWLVAGLVPQTFSPPAVPLAVRSPTFSCWLDMHNGSNPMTTWPTFWNDQHTLGWAGYIKVDGVAWHWMGSPGPGNAGTWLSTAITPTLTILTVQAGPISLNVTFLSPVEPSDLVRQSLPFRYVYVDGISTDGKAHSIQLYADISAEWVTNSLDTAIQWQTKQTGNTVYHRVNSAASSPTFQDVAEDSIAIHAIALTQPSRQSVIGTDQTLRAQVATNGPGITLNSDLPGQSGNVRAGDGKFPVLAHAVDLGTTDTISSIAWVVGVVRDPILTFAGVARHSYYLSQYETLDNAIDAFVVDFPAARDRALALDQQILQDAGAVSQNYADLVSLATRQTMAGVELTVSTNSTGGWDTSDVMAFMKDVGNSQRVNPTEMIYAAMPALMYFNASLIGSLLEPLLQFQNSSQYTSPYAAPDLGTSYPAAPGNTGNNSVYGIENSGNMLILVLAHARTTGDGSLIARYYNLLKQWADYLTTNSLIPAQELPADARDANLAQSHGNLTNLAIKGIIAIQAMSELSQIMGDVPQAQQYGSTAKNLLQSWTTMASSSGEVRWNYDDPSSGGLMYNFLADKLLQLNLLPFSTESSSFFSQPAASPSFGFPLSSDSGFFTRSDWTLFSAAASANSSTRDLLISGIHKRASLNTSFGTFADVYNVETGLGAGASTYPNGYSSPAQGAMFSVLALNVPNKTVIVPPQVGGSSSATAQPSPPTRAKKDTAAIIGGAVATVAVVALLSIALFYLHRRRRSRMDLLVASEPFTAQPSMAQRAETPSAPRTTTSPSEAGSRTEYVQRSKAAPYGPPASEPASPFSQAVSSTQPSFTGTMSSGTEQLRAEMENLRREVAQLRVNQGGARDAPPMYE
ncbi:hypothetical protein GGX14DRAFT_484556 [Mycena pura]|uniref:DUF1793-domain-containing protein n=1 Tax=Mycena pura TaxID=153505 RepID=A0AAD6ULD6_9AGAR|nr:hypothetical protein GGX14DRAFT_484556 [Mycena pura]